MDPLKELDLYPGCTLEEAKKRYRDLSKKFHPDKNLNATSSSDDFRRITDAIHLIQKNPSLLKFSVTPIRISNFIQTEIKISEEDIYYRRSIPVRIERNILCKKCTGTGSALGQKGFCEHCGGTGEIHSKILKMMNKDATCPACRGSGINSKEICSKCRGRKYEPEVITSYLDLDIQEYERRTVILRGIGNEIKPGVFGDVHVGLLIAACDSVFIKDGMFTAYSRITPVEALIGGKKHINVFGKNLVYNVPTDDSEITVMDSREGMNGRRKLRIIFIVKKKKITTETLQLYKKLRALEETIEDQDGS